MSLHPDCNDHVVLLLHGFASSAMEWEVMCDALEEAVRTGRAFVLEAIRRAEPVGGGARLLGFG